MPADYVLDWSAIAAFAAAFVALFGAGVSLWGTWRANKIAERNLAASIEIEIVKFREKWLHDLRVEIAQLFTFIDNVTPDTSDATLAEVHKHKNSVFLMLNMSEKSHEEFCIMSGVVLAQNMGGQARDRNGTILASVSTEDLQNSARAILKFEWERIKNDMRKYNAKNQ